MDNFETRGLRSDLLQLKARMEEIQERLDNEDQETVGIKTIEMESDRDYSKSYTVPHQSTDQGPAEDSERPRSPHALSPLHSVYIAAEPLARLTG